jgi:hypothetical protein
VLLYTFVYNLFCTMPPLHDYTDHMAKGIADEWTWDEVLGYEIKWENEPGLDLSDEGNDMYEGDHVIVYGVKVTWRNGCWQCRSCFSDGCSPLLVCVHIQDADKASMYGGTYPEGH